MMKKRKKIFLIIVAAVAIVAIAAVVVVQTGAMTAVIEAFAPREDALTKRTITTGGKKIPLTYKETATFEGADPLDLYVDAEGNEYSYYKSGELVSIFTVNEADPASDRRISKDAIIKLAQDKGKELLGAEMDAFQVDSYQEFAWGSHSVTFTIRYGKNGYIQGQTLILTFNKDGGFKGMTKRYTEKYNEFDPKWVDSFTQEEMKTSILKKAKEKYKNAVCEVERVELRYDNSFYLNVSVGITHSNGSAELDIFRYDFEQKQ